MRIGRAPHGSERREGVLGPAPGELQRRDLDALSTEGLAGCKRIGSLVQRGNRREAAELEAAGDPREIGEGDDPPTLHHLDELVRREARRHALDLDGRADGDTLEIDAEVGGRRVEVVRDDPLRDGLAVGAVGVGGGRFRIARFRRLLRRDRERVAEFGRHRVVGLRWLGRAVRGPQDGDVLVLPDRVATGGLPVGPVVVGREPRGVPRARGDVVVGPHPDVGTAHGDAAVRVPRVDEEEAQDRIGRVQRIDVRLEADDVDPVAAVRDQHADGLAGRSNAERDPAVDRELGRAPIVVEDVGWRDRRVVGEEPGPATRVESLLDPRVVVLVVEVGRRGPDFAIPCQRRAMTVARGLAEDVVDVR